MALPPPGFVLDESPPPGFVLDSEPKKPSRTTGEAFKDIGAGIVSGLGKAAQFPGQVYGLVSGKMPEETGLYGLAKQIEKAGEEAKSAGLKAQQEELTKKLAGASGILEEAGIAGKEILTNPALLANLIAETAPQMIGPAGLAKAGVKGAAMLGAKGTAKEIAELGAEKAAQAAAQRVGTRAAIGTGAAQQGADIGAETYSDTYKALIEKGVSEDEAKRQAINLARSAGASAAVISLLAQRLPGARRLEQAFAGVPGVGGRALGAVKTGLGESIGEGFEEAGGKLAQNIAMQQVSPEQELLKGVGAAGAMGALPGGVIGAGVGALQTPGLKGPIEEKKEEKQEEKQDEVPKKEPTKEQAMLQLGYTPKVENVEKKDPLRNPVGNFNQDELGKDLVQYVNKFRQTEGRPKLSTFSLEDLVDAGAPQQEIDRLLSFKNRFDESIKLSADDVKNIAQQRNVDTDTIGFKHFLTRSTGTEDVDAMSQPQLHSAFLALSKLKPSEELRVLPEGTNATRFTEAQYANALKGINLALADSPSLGRTSVIKEIQDFTGLENSSDAEAVLKTALDNGDLESIRTPHFALVNENGRVAFVVDSRESAERSVAKAEKTGRKLTIKDGAAIDITLPGEVVELPGGPDVRRGEFKQGEAPEGYEVRVGGDVLATVDNEEEAHDKAERYGATRQKDAIALQKQIDALNKQIESQRAALDQMEARGQGNSLAFQQRSAQVNADNQAAKTQIAQLEQTKGQFLRPLTVKATQGVQSITKEGFTYFEDNKPVATFDTREKADAFALSRLNEDKLDAIAVLGPTLKGLRAKSLGQLAKRELESRGRKGIAVEYKVKEGETAEQAKERVKANLTARGILSAQEQKARAEESKASKEMIEKADKIIADLRPMLNRFGLEKVGISVVESIRNGTADGFYAKQLVRIALDSQDPVGTMRHEVIHALKEMDAFTPEQWKVLEARAKKEWIQKFIVDRGLYEEYQKVYEAQNKGSLEGFDEYIAEEAIADAFKFYKKPQPGLIGNIIYRMRQFFEALKNAFNKNGFKTSDQVFEAIEAGKAKPQQEAKGEGKLSLRQYKLDINREERVKQKRISLPYDEQQAVDRDADKLQLTKRQVASLIKTIKDNKKRYPQSQGWAPLEVIGIGIELDENQKPIQGTEFPKYKAIAYSYNVPAGSRKAPPKIDQAWLGKVTKEFQKLVENLYKRASKGDVNAKNIIAHQTWYKNVAKTLRAEYGGFGDVLADLLGATSPNTPVDTNWRFSVDAMRRFVRGEFNSELEKFSNYLDQGKSPSKYPSEDKIRQITGKLYGMNSTNAMLALVDMWRIIKPGQAPKARNFALNLIGQSNIATIDVWAARMLRRAANFISKGEYARIPPPAETGVSGTWNASATDITGAFGFGAEVMRQTSENLKAKGINIDPPDLQAIAWFAEKELWGTKGWTSKTGEGGSFEENIEENPADRYLAGHSIQVGETAPSKEETVKVQQQILDVLRNDPSVIAVRTKTTKGLYGGTVEESFDSEWVVDKDKFDPAPIISKLAEVSKSNTQFDIFVSKVIGPNEDNPNARPGIEIYFKTQQDLDAVMPILQAFTSKGQDGFTLAVDPRAAEDSNRYMGVRLQYVPEISMRWDEDLRRKLKDPEVLKSILEEKAEILERIAAEVAQMEEVAYAAALKYDTVVIGQENYDAYISARASGKNRPVGKGVWFGQPIRDHVEAAIDRYTRGQIDEGAVPDGGEAQARYSIRPPESAVRPGEGSRRGITLGKQQKGAGTVEGIHYGKAKVDVLNGGMFGSGIRGEEAKRLAQSQDSRIKKRVYFYIPNEVGFVMRPEAGLGQHVYTQTFNNILPQNEEMARLYRSVDKDLNAFESAVIDEGYDGYAVPSNGMMVILNHDVPVNYEGLAYELREQGKLVQNKVKYSLRTVFDPAITARMDATTAPRESKGFVQRVLDAVSPESRAKIRSGLIHGLEGFERSAKRRAAKMGNQELLADVSSIAAASQSLRAAAITSESFRRGIPVYTKGYTTIDDSVKGLMDVLTPLAKAKDPEIFRYFQFYAASKRGARLDSEGREQVFEQADLALAAQLAAQAKSIGIDFDSVYKDYQRYNEGIVKFSRDTGVLSAEQADYFMKFGDYIPFYRQMQGQETIGPKLFSSFSNVAVPKKLKGGEAKIGDFMENAVRNARSAIEAGMKNIAAQRGIRDALDEGLANKVSGFQQRTPDIVSVRENGNTVYYQLADPLLVEAFKGLNIQKHPWVSIAAKPADWLRSLVTKDPGFMLANIMRDSVSSWVTSGSSMIPVVDSFKQMGKILAGNNPTAAAMAKAGLGGYEFTGDLESSAKDLEKELRKKSGTRTITEKTLLPVTAAWDLLEKGSNASDMATRAEVYERVLKETGNEAEAFYQACEVLNFSRKGNWPVIQVFTALVPFMNARIQGLDILYRSGFGQMATANKEKMQKAFIVRSLSILALSAAYWALVHDDDEYKKLTEEERDNYWIIPGTNVNGKPLRFPIPFELGFMFKVMPERIAETMWGEDTGKQFTESIQRNLISTLKVNPIPQAITPLVENAYNISLFTGEPIVGRGLEKVEPKYQATASTSSLALMIGDQFDVSPLKVDNLIRGYTGTMGMYAATMLDGVFSGQGDPVRATKRFEQLPVVKRFVSTDSGTVAAFFDFKNEVDSAVRTFNFLEKNDPEELVKRLDAGDLSLYGLRSYINSIDKEMTKVREVRTAVNASKDMTPDEKRVMLDSLHEVELALTTDVKAIRKQYH